MTSGAMRRALALAVALSTLASACWFGGDDDDATNATDPPQPPATVPSTDDPIVTVNGGDSTSSRRVAAQLGIQLSEGSPVADVAENAPRVTGEPIAPDDIAAIFDRLGSWDVPPTDQVEFNRPPESLAPPLVGDTVEGTFPPAPTDDGPGDTSGGPLEVLRFQPEGPVGLAPFITVTFNQPMVALGTLDQLDAADIPLVITPAIDGRWRWIGTRTLRFELVPGELDRLPAATEYTIEVPAGTTAATGAQLAESVSWSFETPAPSVVSLFGNSNTTGLEPVFVATFDQRVDANEAIAAISMNAGGEVALRLATDDEIDATPGARGALDRALDSRAVAFRPSARLPAATPFKISIGPNIPSAEGPLTSTEIATYDGATFGSLTIADTWCDGDCEPGAGFGIRFSNALDLDAFTADQVQIEPAIASLSIDVYGDVIALRGATIGRTTYQVTLDGELRDVFGQTLGETATVDFRVGSAQPGLLGLQRDWFTLDPTAEIPLTSITSINLDDVRVRAWAVSPADLDAFREYQDAMWSDQDAPEPDWPMVLDELVPIDGEPDRFVETPIDLSDAFVQSGSQMVVRIDSTLDLSRNDDLYWRNRPTLAWVQQTTVGIDAFYDNETLLIWTTDLATGEPLDGVPVELVGDGRVATTDEHGVAELEIGDVGVRGLWANTGDRTAFLPADRYDGWSSRERTDDTRWYIVDDRGIYKPGETVRLNGWLRRFTWSVDAQLALLEGDLEVNYEAFDPQGNQIAIGETTVNALGGWNLAFEVPAGANLGIGWVQLTAATAGSAFSSTQHSISIQEFRRPEFEVTAANETPGPHFSATPSTVRVDAEYFSGGALADAEVSWLVSTRNATYSPPNWGEFAFGEWTPWWEYEFSGAVGDFGDDCFDCGPVFDSTVYETFEGRTGPDGSHYLDIDFDGPDVDLPTSVTAEATVFDVNRQAWAARTDLLVHSAEYYVGLRSDRAFVRRGTPIRIDAVVTDVDGGTVPGREVTVTAGRTEWVFSGGRWDEQLVDEQDCTFTSTGDASDESMRCEFATEVGGTYQITAIVEDDTGQRNRTQITQWVSGGSGRPTRNVEQQAVTLVPDLEFYAPGDTAEVLVQAPFAPAHGLVTITRGEIVSTETFVAEDGSTVLEIPIDDSMVPNITIHVEVVGSEIRFDDTGTPQPELPARTAFATGQIDLAIPPISRTLTVDATPADAELEPGDNTSVTVAVSDADGNPVDGANVAVIVVDEAVLALTDYELADPLSVFYRNISSELRSVYTRASVLLNRADLVTADGDSRLATGNSAAPSADVVEESASDDAGEADAGGDFAQGSATPIDIRTDFRALAVYAPDETTDASGQVSVDVSLPDSLTRYRVMAVAVAGADQFGTDESSITARLPLQLRPSAPRFLNFGDRFELPVVVQNQTDTPIEVDVAIQIANLSHAGVAGQRVTVPANDRVEVRFPLETDQVGTARFRVAAVSGDFADAAALELPVYTPATAEAFATYGVVDQGAIAQPTLAPTEVFSQFGGLEINTSSTALQALTDAVLYLAKYRYESADGLASRIMAVATLRDVLEAFDSAELPSSTELNAAVVRDLEALARLQNDDGGFPSWQRGRESVPWVSIQTTLALVLAEQAGYTVPDDTLARALDHLASIEEFYPSTYSQGTKDSLSAFALHVRAKANQRDVRKATDLYRRAGDALQPDAIAWLWPSIIDDDLRTQIEVQLTNLAVETAGAATFATSYGEDAYVIAHSDRRTDGVVLDALITQVPDSDLIPKVVAGLLGNQTRGRWNNAHENAFILIAMNAYFNTFEAVDPDFVARAWLGDLYAAEAEFVGRTTDRVTTLVPMVDVIEAGDSLITIDKTGDGRLYYRLGLRYAPADLNLDARDEGFVVDRVYEAIDDPNDVTQDADGNWLIKAGASVRVRLTMVADARRTYVALIDPLPAGLEPVNPALAVSPTTPADEDADRGGWSWYWGWNWFEHQNLRDDRVEAFTSYLPGGTYEYTYVARATTPGEFIVPPTRAEEIYAPEVFGRSATASVIID